MGDAIPQAVTEGPNAADAPIAAPEGATCLKCRYPLRDLPTNVCPECGTAFDPTLPWTMLLKGVRSADAMRTLQPTVRSFRLLKTLLVIIGVWSAWFVAPHPIPTLILIFVWFCYGVPQVWRSSTRERIVRQHSLSTELLKIDDADLRRLRRCFYVALLVIGLQLPFMTAYAISYPFLHRTAWHWWAEVPATQEPTDEQEAQLMLRGVFLVKMRVHTNRVDFDLPTGTITLGPEERNGWLVGHWH